MMTKEEQDRFCDEFAATWASEKTLKRTLREYIATVKDYENFLIQRGLFDDFKQWLNNR